MKRKKRIVLSIYYFGLVAGALVFNYIILFHEEFSLELIESFYHLDKLNHINLKELFFYLNIQRLKQAAVFLFLYYYFPGTLVLILVDLYGGFLIGGVSSLFLYYCGIKGLIYACILFMPILVCGVPLYYGMWKLQEYDKNGNSNKLGKWFIIVIILTIIETILEMCVNRWLVPGFIINK